MLLERVNPSCGEGADPILPEELQGILGMLDKNQVVGGRILLREDPLSRAPLEESILAVRGSHPGLGDPLSEGAVGEEILTVWGHILPRVC